jgi:hypothetical protein
MRRRIFCTVAVRSFSVATAGTRNSHPHSISRQHACYQYSLPPDNPTTNFPTNHHRLAVNIRKVFFFTPYIGETHFAREWRPWCTVKLVSLPLEHNSQPIILVENFLFMTLKSEKRRARQRRREKACTGVE